MKRFSSVLMLLLVLSGHVVEARPPASSKQSPAQSPTVHRRAKASAKMEEPQAQAPQEPQKEFDPQDEHTLCPRPVRTVFGMGVLYYLYQALLQWYAMHWADAQ